MRLRMAKLFMDMDWNSFLGLPVEDLAEHGDVVRASTFDGAFKEAQCLYGQYY